MEGDNVLASKDAKLTGKVRKHTVLETSKGKVYVCKLCNESFDKSYALANHVKSFCPKRALFKKDSSTSSLNHSSESLYGDKELHNLNDDQDSYLTTNKESSKKRKKSKTSHHQEAHTSTTTTSYHSVPLVSDTYENPLRHTAPGDSNHPEEYDKTFLANFPLDLVYKLKSLKALKIALDSTLITPEQFLAKQQAFIHSVDF